MKTAQQVKDEILALLREEAENLQGIAEDYATNQPHLGRRMTPKFRRRSAMDFHTRGDALEIIADYIESHVSV